MQYGTKEYFEYRDAVLALGPINSPEKAAAYREVLFQYGMIESTEVPAE